MKSSALICLFLVGCATESTKIPVRPIDPPSPSNQEILNADIGPMPENFKELIKAYFGNTLKDPYSAVYLFNGIPKKTAVLRDGHYIFLWRTSLSVNAKNSYGGYTGSHDYSCDFSNGALTNCFDLTELLREADRLDGRY